LFTRVAGSHEGDEDSDDRPVEAVARDLDAEAVATMTEIPIWIAVRVEGARRSRSPIRAPDSSEAVALTSAEPGSQPQKSVTPG